MTTISSTPGPGSSALAPVLTDYLDWHFDANPVFASALGAPGYATRLGEFGATAFEQRRHDRAGWLDRFAAVDAAALSTQDAIDRDLVLSALRGEAVLDDWPLWRRDPAVYLGPVFSGLLMPFLHRLHPEAEIVDGVVARLAEVPAVLAACRENLDPELASPLLVRRALGQASAGPAFLRDSLPAEVGDDALRRRLVDAAAPAIDAFTATEAFLTGFAERASGTWRMGERHYSALLTQRELLGYGADELHRRGEKVLAELDEQMSALAAQVPGGSRDWRATMEALQADFPPTLEAMRAEYEAETERARAFLVDRELVSFADGEQCRVVPAPAYQRPILAVASYMSPPPLTGSRVGHFFVPFTADGASDEDIEQRLRTNARVQLPTISVHEAYPGHHWQLSWAANHAPTVRAVHRSSYFAEGWALYAEGMMREQGYFTNPAHELGHLDARIFRAARIVVDTALHCGEMEPEQAESFMATHASLTPGTAAGEVSRYCAWPTQAPSYLTGCLEIEQLRGEWYRAGAGGLREFHDILAGSGCLPLGLARRVLSPAGGPA